MRLLWITLSGCTWITADGYTERADLDGDGVDGLVDCDDANAGLSVLQRYFVDQDGDGFGDRQQLVEACSTTAPPGTVVDAGDCDDDDPSVHPDAPEVCNGVDDDCDTLRDDEDPSRDPASGTAWIPDADGDGFAGADALDQTVRACTAPSGFVMVTELDCRDDDAQIHPDAVETCGDGLDNDCDGLIDNSEQDLVIFYVDADSDGWPDNWRELSRCNALPGLVAASDAPPDTDEPDCDPAAPGTFPGASDSWYDGVDSDCAGNDDFDQDGDGVRAVEGGGTDCDDTVAAVYPGAADSWYDGVDSDCAGNDDFDQDGDGVRDVSGGGDDCDDEDPSRFPGNVDAWYDGVDGDCAGDDDFDQDGDGARAALGGGSDCNDLDSAAYPGAPELWYDGIDQDCLANDDFDQDGDGVRSPLGGGDDCDDTDPAIHPGAVDDWYDGIDSDCAGNDDFDQDGDGYVALSAGGDDCDDTDATRSPGAIEVWYDGVDSDCAGDDDDDQDGDGALAIAAGGDDCDDLDPARYPGAADDWYDGVDSDCAGNDDFDLDGDGFRHPDGGGSDCDDLDASVFPGATETWYDGVDADCAGDSDDDQDGDGRTPPEATTGTRDDCNDLDPTIFFGAADVPDDGIDQDCSGTDSVSCFLDADEDGFGVVATVSPSGVCADGLTDVAGDCDDADSETYPGAPELCDGTDQDCNGIAEGDNATATLRSGDRIELTSGATVNSMQTERVDVCGGTWDLQLQWNPADGDFGLHANPAYSRPVLSGSRQLLVGGGTGRTRFSMSGFELLYDNPSLRLLTVVGNPDQRPALRIEDLIFAEVTARALLETTDVDVLWQDNLVVDTDVDDHGIEVVGGSLLMFDSAFENSSRVPERSGFVQEEGFVYGLDCYAQVASTSFEGMFGRAMKVSNSVIEMFGNAWIDNEHEAAVQNNSIVDPFGAALWATDSVVSDEGSLFAGNSALEGSGITTFSSDLTLIDTRFERSGHPRATYVSEYQRAGRTAAALRSSGRLTMRNVNILDSYGSSGAAAFTHTGGDYDLENVVVEGVEVVGPTNSFAAAAWLSADDGEGRVNGLRVRDVSSVGSHQYCVGLTRGEVLDASGLDVAGCDYRAVRLQYLDRATVRDSVFTDTNGALEARDTELLEVYDSNFMNIQSTSGPGITSQATETVLSGNAFVDNVATGSGGAVAAFSGSLSTCGDVFQGNRANNDGGAIFVNGGVLQVGGPSCAQTRFVDNEASNRGGAIAAPAGSSRPELTLQNARFESNRADIGGALYIEGGLQVDSTEFESNVATDSGGAVHGVLEYALWNLGPGVVFEDNQATTGGGLALEGTGFAADLAPLPMFEDTVFRENEAIEGAALHTTVIAGVHGTWYLDELPGPIDLLGGIAGSIELDGNIGNSVLVRGGPEAPWLLQTTAVTPQVLDDGGAICSLNGAQLLDCPTDGACACP